MNEKEFRAALKRITLTVPSMFSERVSDTLRGIMAENTDAVGDSRNIPAHDRDDSKQPIPDTGNKDTRDRDFVHESIDLELSDLKGNPLLAQRIFSIINGQEESD